MGKSTILIWENKYVIKSDISRNLLLKIIIRENHLYTNAMMGLIGDKLSALNTYLPQVVYNILKLNQNVSLMVQALGSRGETTQDPLSNFFKGYFSCSDRIFVTYIEKN